MELRIVAVGRIGKTPEADLVADYIKRAGHLSRAVGISKISITELDERKMRETAAQLRAITETIAGEAYWAMDERGDVLSSPQFSAALQKAADQITGRLNIVIGGADGLSDGLRDGALQLISFGKMVWPHMLVRVMLSEQIYRATAIRSNLPYHRA